ncbi:MAG: SiaC family regulatory phosphoprotein [Bacteroidales bacterium]|nr:SiaC family regulatory phosphoprotein [Bacteroidales bacterium]
MAAYKIKGEEDIPSIILDSDANVFEISGRSLPENAVIFYKPVLAWLDNYAKNPLPRTEFVFNMHYYNTATAKQILEILLRLEDIYSKGHDVRVTWIYESGDIDMEDAGVEYGRTVNVPIILTDSDTAAQHAKTETKPQQETATETTTVSVAPQKEEPVLKKNETFVVTIGRELGAGGRLIGRLLAERLRINYFDYAVIEALSTQYDADTDNIVNTVSKDKNWWSGIRDLIKTNISKLQDNSANALNDKQQQILNHIARNESCIVAGQSAFYIFRDFPNHINIFICASYESRVAKMMTREKISREKAIEIIDQVAKDRDIYVVENTGMPRHDTRNYDLVINMDKITEEDAVNLIINYIEQRKKYFALLVDND